MGQRQRLQTILEIVLGSPNVYFQPPPSIRLSYPAIVYSRENAEASFADNNPYRRTKRYSVTVVDRNPDSPIPDKVGRLPMTTHTRFYSKDGLNHDVFRLYFEGEDET